MSDINTAAEAAGAEINERWWGHRSPTHIGQMREIIARHFAELEADRRAAIETAKRAQWDQDTAHASLLEALERAGALEADKRRLDWLEKHADSVDVSGYGADDKWVTLLHHDGNKAESSTIREVVDTAMSSGQESK